MAPLPPGRLSKGMIQERIDEIINDDSLREKFLDALENPGNQGKNWLQFLVNHGVAPGGADYLFYSWFNAQPPNPKYGQYWEKHQPIEPIIRQSLVESIKLVTHNPDTGERRKQTLRISSYWMCVGNEDDDSPEYATVEGFVTWDDERVTCILLTPFPKGGVPLPPDQMKAVSNIIAVKPYEDGLCPYEEHRDIDPSVGEDNKTWRTVRFKKQSRPLDRFSKE